MQTSYAVRSWSKLQCRLNHSKQCWKIIIQWVTLASFCSLKKRCLQWQRRKKPAEWPTLHTFISREERCRYKKPTHMIDVQSVTDDVSWRVTRSWQYANFTFASHEIKVSENYCRNSMSLLQCLPPYVTSQASSSSLARYTVVTSNTGHL